jgi:hypothetical protein
MSYTPDFINRNLSKCDFYKDSIQLNNYTNPVYHIDNDYCLYAPDSSKNYSSNIETFDNLNNNNDYGYLYIIIIFIIIYYCFN